MEDDLKKNKNRRRPQKNGRRPQKIKMEDDLKKRGKRPKKRREKKGRQPQKKGKKGRRHKKKKKIFSRFLLGANLSWGWLSSLRFLLFILCRIYLLKEISVILWKIVICLFLYISDNILKSD